MPDALARLVAEVQAWIADDVEPAAQTELQTLLDQGDWEELGERFRESLTFGTAGLRGPLRAGPNGMNRAVVRRAAAGIGAWLRGHRASHAGIGSVVIGYDARHGSYDFAHDSAGILTAAGFDVAVLPRPLPTPVLAYSVLAHGADVGIMVTASHNPPQDNGYKVYVADGAQIVPPTDAEIEAEIRAITSVAALPLHDGYRVLDDELVDKYCASVVALSGPPERDLRIVHTAMHGVGTEVMTRVLGTAGFTDVTLVNEQAEPDPDFPTVAFPNPEEPGALDLAIALAENVNADLIIANDPDADRCGAAVPTPTGWRMLRGDEVGVLLADALMRQGIRGTYATTIVSSSLLGVLSADAGVGFTETLTGFKWLSRAAPDLVYAYEEALGYAVAPALVRDKDGVSAGLLLAKVAAQLKSEGSSLLGRLAELAEKYGLYATDQLSVRVTDLTEITAAMQRLRSSPPTTLLGEAVRYEDLLPRTDGVRLSWNGGRVVVRPSGTEPKLKAYLEVVIPTAPRVEAGTADTAGTTDTIETTNTAGTADTVKTTDTAHARLQQLRREMAAALGL